MTSSLAQQHPSPQDDDVIFERLLKARQPVCAALRARAKNLSSILLTLRVLLEQENLGAFQLGKSKNNVKVTNCGSTVSSRIHELPKICEM